MHLLSKTLLWLFAGTAVLVSVLVTLLFFIDVNVYHDRIEQRISEALGRDIVLEGPLDLEPSLFPRIAVNGLKITNPDWASRPYLASVKKFDLRVSLLPLLRGELNILSLELRGVDLLLEKTSDGINNFTFGEPGEAATSAAIKRLSLYDITAAYVTPGNPVRQLHAEHITARKIPGKALQLEAHTAINDLPVSISLHAELSGELHPSSVGKVTLLGEAGSTRLRLDGSMANPPDWRQGEYRLEVKAGHLGELATLSGINLPQAGPFRLATDIDFKTGDHLAISNLSARLGNSDIDASLRWDLHPTRSAIKAKITSRQLDIDELSGGLRREHAAVENIPAYLDQPIDLQKLIATDHDIEIEIQKLSGMANPAGNIFLKSRADRQHLRLEVTSAGNDQERASAMLSLPWGEQLATRLPEVSTPVSLLQHASVEIQAQAGAIPRAYTTSLFATPLSFTLSNLSATAKPDKPLTITGKATLNDKPLDIHLQTEPLGVLAQHSAGPWRAMSLKARGDNIHLEVNGSAARPLEAGGLDLDFALGGSNIETLLPLQGAWSLTGSYTVHASRKTFSELKLTVGSSDIDGSVTLDDSGDRPRLDADINAGQIHLDELLPESGRKTAIDEHLEQPLAVAGISGHDLDIKLRVQRLLGLDIPVENIRVDVEADAEMLTLAPMAATLDGTYLGGRVQLPWGERLNTGKNTAFTAGDFLQLADLELVIKPPESKLRRPAILMGHPVDITLAGAALSARSGKKVQINASALLDTTPLDITLQALPLGQLLRHPSGPWQQLALEIRGSDMLLQATGSVDRPFEAAGFDIHYTLRGARVDALLPVVNLMLPLEGTYSLSGHFADKPDRLIFDKLKILSGDSDIGGTISVYHDSPRTRIVANLESEQFYLSKLFPVSESAPAEGAVPLVIPDYELPIDRLREFDGELNFRGKRLRTAAGDLGDISFKATLQDGVFRMEPFTVRGWAGAGIESGLTLDAAREPPLMTWQWNARQLNYGVLLKQAGLAETVEGHIDITLRLSGSGRTRREFLGDADGQLVVVGEQGLFGSRRLDLWGSDLLLTMLSNEWRSDDVTDINCVVARINIEDGIASSDKFIIDTRRITIAATGSLDLADETLNLVVAPQPKRTSLLSLTNPVHVTGTLAEPEVAVTLLPRNRMAAAGSGILAGLINPGYLIFTFSQTGSGQANACETAVAETMAIKADLQGQTESLPEKPRKRFSLLPGCTSSTQRQRQ